jgi:uncharacterized protein YdeI (BOF family)
MKQRAFSASARLLFLLSLRFMKNSLTVKFTALAIVCGLALPALAHEEQHAAADAAQARIAKNTVKNVGGALRPNTVEGVLRNGREDDFALLRGKFVKKTGEAEYEFSDGNDSVAVDFSGFALPADFELNTSYYLWAQLLDGPGFSKKLKILSLSPKNAPVPGGLRKDASLRDGGEDSSASQN